MYIYGTYLYYDNLLDGSKCFYVNGKCLEKASIPASDCNLFSTSYDACTSDKNGLNKSVLNYFLYFYNFIYIYIYI
jgi:hypothetical protein